MKSPTSMDPWDKVVSHFRQVCLLHREGRTTDSRRILAEELPRSIAIWSRGSGLDPTAKRMALERMFREEQRRIDDAWLVQKWVLDRMSEELIPVLCSRLAEEVRDAVTGQLDPGHPRPRRPVPTFATRSRVAVDDLPGIIDLVLSEQGREVFAAANAS